MSYDWQVIVQFRRKLIVHLISKHSMNFSSNFIVCVFLFSNSISFCFFFSLVTSTDDRSTLSDDDEGISQDDLDNEDISRKAIHRALLVNHLFRNSNDLFFFVILFRSIEMY